MDNQLSRLGDAGRYVQKNMSVDYIATLSPDAKRCVAIVNGDDTSLPLNDRDRIRLALLGDIPGMSVNGPSEDYTLLCDHGCFIEIYVGHYFVEITHRTGGDENEMLDSLESIMSLLAEHGLYIYDPQNDQMLG